MALSLRDEIRGFGQAVLTGFVMESASFLCRCGLLIAVSLCISACPESSRGEVLIADFDDLPVGSLGNSPFTDGGITFSNLDTRGGFYNRFSIQLVSAGSGFSAPNCLGFGQPNSNPGRFGSMDISFSGEATTVSLDVFATMSLPGWENLLTLQGLNGGGVVDSQTVLVSYWTPFDGQLRIFGNYDSVRLIASGEYSQGTVMLELDNVTLTVIPEPQTVCLLCVGLAFFCRRFRHVNTSGCQSSTDAIQAYAGDPG